MTEILSIYALLQTFYEKGRDYIDSFWPFVLKGFKENAGMNKENILSFLKNTYDIYMPYHVLDIVLDRILRKKYIRKKNKIYYIRNSGIDYVDSMIDENLIERRINSLIEDIFRYSGEKGITVNVSEIRNMFFRVLRNNVYNLVESINPDLEFEIENAVLEVNDELIVEYIKIAQKSKPKFYAILQEMIFGSLISSILYTKGYTDYSIITSSSFIELIAYLDTNYLINILELDYKENTQPAIELYNLMQLNKIKLIVFSFTIDELCRVLNGYDDKKIKYPTNLEIGHLYGFLKRNGWTKAKIKEYILQIEDIINEKGIKIDYEEHINLINYKPSNINIVKSIMKYKPDLNINGIFHDLYAIDRISSIRKKPFRRFDTAKYYFLTSDLKLNKFNLLEMGHKQNSTVGEVLLDRTLTNLLWLKKPENNPSLTSIISTHSRDLFIKPSVWEAFYKKLALLKEQKRVDNTDITMLFYDNNMEEILKGFSDKDADKITTDLIIEQIERARVLEGEMRYEIKSQLQSEYEQLMEAQRRESEVEKRSEIEEIIKERDQRNKDEWYDYYKTLKENMWLAATEQGNFYAYIYSLIISLVYVLSLYALWWIASINNVLEFYKLIIYAFGLGGVYGIFTRAKTMISKRVIKKIYENKLQELKIQEKNDE